MGSSPLSRGIRQQRPCDWAHKRIIPALAGNTLVIGHDEHDGGDHPRSRGEYSDTGLSDFVAQGSSPLSRGILQLVGIVNTRHRIIPALAGNTPQALLLQRTPADHPRSRGEYATVCPAVTFCPGSSPLSRGIQIGVKGRHISFVDHPRSRGEYRMSPQRRP